MACTKANRANTSHPLPAGTFRPAKHPCRQVSGTQVSVTVIVIPAMSSGRVFPDAAVRAVPYSKQVSDGQHSSGPTGVDVAVPGYPRHVPNICAVWL